MESTIFILKKTPKDSIARTLANEAGVSLEVLNPLEGLTNEQIENGEKLSFYHGIKPRSVEKRQRQKTR